MTTDASNSLHNAEHPTLSSMFLTSLQSLDPEGWRRLVHVFGPIVYRWCRTSGISEQDAADVVQEVFASVARGIPKFQPQKEQGSFRSWLATITRNRVRDYFRKYSRAQPATGGTAAHLQWQQLEESLDSTISTDSTRSSVVRRVLEGVRAEFEKSTWQAFWLTAVEGQSAAEVSAAISISTASVYQAKSRVLRRLRQRLAEMLE